MAVPNHEAGASSPCRTSFGGPCGRVGTSLGCGRPGLWSPRAVVAQGCGRPGLWSPKAAVAQGYGAAASGSEAQSNFLVPAYKHTTATPSTRRRGDTSRGCGRSGRAVVAAIQHFRLPNTFAVSLALIVLFSCDGDVNTLGLAVFG